MFSQFNRKNVINNKSFDNKSDIKKKNILVKFSNLSTLVRSLSPISFRLFKKELSKFKFYKKNKEKTIT